MRQLQGILDEAVAAGDAPFLVGMAASGGGVLWQGAAGTAAPGRAAGPDTVLRIFSMTKAIGATAAMILLERGQIALDTPVTEILPDFAAVGVLEGWDGDTPRLRAPRRPVTLRHLASHSSGLEYETWNPKVADWLARSGHPPMRSGRRQALFYPLMSDPGTRWGYGIGIDWLGRVVEAVAGQPIDAFLRTELFDPLGMHDTDVVLRPDMAPRLAAAQARTAGGGFTPLTLPPPEAPEMHAMGHCLLSTAADYMRFLRMLLGRGRLDGVQLLAPETVAVMLQNHIGALRVGPMHSVNPRNSADVALFPGIPKTHSLAFLRVEADVPGMRRAGAQGWAGLLNTHCWIDPAADRAGLFLTQTLPFAEPRVMAAFARFERALYAAGPAA